MIVGGVLMVGRGWAELFRGGRVHPRAGHQEPTVRVKGHLAILEVLLQLLLGGGEGQEY